MGKNPLKKMIDGEYGPELEYTAYFRMVVVHEELEGVEGGYIKGQ